MDNLQVTPVQADSTKINSLVVQGEGKPKRNCADWLRDVRMSADVNRTTVGVESERVTPDLMLATSKKLLRVARREEEPDPKDSLEFQRFYGPAEYFAEHIMRDGGKLGRNLLWKATNKGNLDFMQPGALDQHVSDVFYNSMLAQMVDGSSPLELAHATYKTTRIGEGGVGDMESAPDEMRLVQPSFFGYIDPVLSPECYSADTELMTSKGWLSIADVTEDTELACLVDGRLEYHRPEALHKYDGSYSMYCFESSNGISYKVTENHRMYTSCNYALRDGSPCSYLIKTAQEIHGKERRVKTGGHKPLLRNEDCSTFALPEVSPVVKHAQVRGKPPLGANLKNVPEVNVFDFAEYMGWYLAEGNVEIDEESGKYHAVISQSRIEHPDNWNRINELCKRLPFNFGGSSDDHRISIGRKQLAIYLKQFGGSADKFIPQWIFDAPLKARELFRYALLQGDGREQKHLCTMSKRLAEDFARLQFELGESVRILHEPEKRIAGHSGIWVVQWHSRKESTLRGSKRIKGGEKGYFTEEYNGSVYCPTVPGGLVYCRRNGHTGFWCGNSQRVGLDSYITKNCIKGSDGKLYTKFINAHTGKEELVDSVTAAKSIVAAPEMRNAKTKSVFALGGPTGVRIVPRGKIDYYLPNADNAYSMASNMVPMFNGVKEMRLVMGCLHPATNLLVIGRRNEMRIVRASELNGSGEGVYGCGTGGDPAVFRLRNTVAKPPFEARWFRRITLLSGRTITVSKDHRCPLLKGGAMTLEEAGSIRKGDRMLRASFTDIPNRRTFVTGRLVNREMAAFLGLLCRDSHLKGGRISFAMYGRQEKAVGKALKSLGLKPGPVSGGRMELDGGEFTAWYRDEVGSYKAARRVPSCILSSNADICAAFLDAYTTDRNLVGEDACEDIWILDIPNTVVRDGLALLLSRVRIDCAFRDCVHGGSPSYALRLFTMCCDLGSLIADEVKSVEVVRNEPFMIDLDIDDNMYAVANGIVTHNSKYAQQAVSLEHREPPLVRCIDQDTGEDMPTLAGKYLGAQFAQKPGRVLAVRQDRVDVQYDDGTKGAIPLYVNFPMNAKGYITSTPQLKAGDHFGKGDCVASSNYTDDKGVSAIGTTMRTGWLSWKGGTYEDGVTLSESAAKKLTSTTMYKTDVDLDRTIKLGKSNYTAWKPSGYNTEQLGVLDDNGVVRPGTVLHKGDPMILAVRTAEPSPGTLGKRILVDMSETWEHDNPGTVTDVVQTRKGVKVFATVTAPAEVGDKVAGAYGNKGVVAQILPDDQMPQDSHGKPLEMLLSPLGLVSRCYDEETEFLTEGGWKYGRDVLDSDRLYCYDPESGKWHWGPQLEPFHRAYYRGRMYGHRNALTDFLVTPGHRVWARTDFRGSRFSERRIEDIYGKRYSIPCVASGMLEEPQETRFTLPEIPVRPKDTHTTTDKVQFDAGDWAEFLGWYMAEGNTTFSERDSVYRVNIAQFDTVNEENVRRISRLLDRLGFKYNYGKANKQFHINSKRLASYLKGFGYAWEKHVPEWLFRQPSSVIMRFIDAIFAGDGRNTLVKSAADGRGVYAKSITLTSERLIDQLQALFCLIGIPTAKHAVAKDRRYCNAHTLYRLGVSTVSKSSRSLKAGWYTVEDYDGMTYCPTVDTGYILTRRNGKVACLGNTNPSQLHEAVLGKIAKKTGEVQRIPQFYDGDLYKYVMDKAKQAHVSPDDDFTDPETGRTVKGVVNGYSYIYKLKHLAESKLSARGTDEYDQDQVPAGKGMTGSKRYGGLEQTALVGHNAFDAILDAKLLRGQSNSEFWRSIRTGGIPTIPGEPLVHRKFFAHLTGAGINVRRTPKGISCFTLSKGDVDELAGPRELKSRDTYEAKNFRPIDGGLFGQDIFGMNGDKWAYIRLDEPLPNPVMEEPLARLLRIPVKDFEAVAAGAKEVDGMKSSADIEARLKGMDLAAEAEKAKRELKDSSHSKRDNALKRYVAIENMRRNGVKPADYMLDKIPVLPPIYRPISSHSGLTMVADSNYLYAQLLDMRDDLRDSMSLPAAYQQKARANLYRGWKELAGLYDPEDVKLKNKNVGGLLKWALGDSPKWSAWQRKVVGATVDTVGRGVVTPDPRIRLNELGIPKDMAFGMMAPFVERALVKRGYTPIDAMKAVKQRTKLAGEVLLEVMKTHPVQMNRAPTLHKYNVMAFQPVLAAGHAIHVNPSIVVPFNMDFDGDTANIHVPVSDKARQDLRQRMFPERNLLAVRDRKILYKPEKEYQQGLYIATRMKDAGKVPSRMFNTVDEAREAYRQGLIDIDDPITIRDAH